MYVMYVSHIQTYTIALLAVTNEKATYIHVDTRTHLRIKKVGIPYTLTVFCGLCVRDVYVEKGCVRGDFRCVRGHFVKK